jgi:hypothetical protein
MEILAQIDAYMGTLVDLVAVLGLLLSTLNTIVCKQFEMEKRYSHCGPLFSKELKYLKTLPLEEFGTILLAWFKQARITNACIDGSHLKGKGSTCSC